MELFKTKTSLNLKTNSLKDVVTSSFGFQHSLYTQILSRYEVINNLFSVKINPRVFFIIERFILSIYPLKSSIRKKTYLNIYLLDLIHSYRGWRHLKGLPVNGQRTWSNAWTSYKTNTALRELKLIISKRIYGQGFENSLSILFLAEAYNNLWRVHWRKEWVAAKKKRLLFLKNLYGVYKIDLYTLARGEIENPQKSKKVKKKVTKNSFSLGFEPGFTKNLVKLLGKTLVKSKLKVQVLLSTPAKQKKKKK